MPGNQRNVIIIPARLNSKRFPGKLLELLDGRPLLDWVYKNSVKSKMADEIVVATDSPQIALEMEALNNKVILTSSDPVCGTERCAEALRTMTAVANVINVQGDQLFVNACDLDRMFECLVSRHSPSIVSLCRPLDPADRDNADRVKVICDDRMNARNFSRVTGKDQRTFMEHIGIYGFRADVLTILAQLSPTPNEQKERLEQLRWMDHGYTIKMIKTEGFNLSIDRPEDLEAARIYVTKFLTR